MATLKKDLLLLTRDKVGLLFMFGMPIVLAVLITAVQNSTFDLVNNNKVSLVLCNADTGACSRLFRDQIEKAGIFDITEKECQKGAIKLNDLMEQEDALVGIFIPSNFTEKIRASSILVTEQILHDLGISGDRLQTKQLMAPSLVTIYYNPVMQESFRYSIRGAVNGAIQLTENKQLLNNLYANFNEKASPDSLENMIREGQTGVKEITVSQNGMAVIPNATQHNIPAWTVFAMFFVVISLGGGIVREKTNGSFLRLRTLPTSFLVSLLSKQITYLVVTISQTIIIFMIGVFLFPAMHLPKLVLPESTGALFLITFFSGWCAVSYAMCVGVFARTEEQSNGFGAITVVILAAIGGILVPSFAMPNSFRTILNFSPLHWCLESYYGLFLRHASFGTIIMSLMPLLGIILFLQLLTFFGLRQKRLI
ncbi:MAG: ABC transporter permease [bacterium]|nr:ABC transporter permease [bacterium]